MRTVAPVRGMSLLTSSRRSPAALKPVLSRPVATSLPSPVTAPVTAPLPLAFADFTRLSRLARFAVGPLLPPLSFWQAHACFGFVGLEHPAHISNSSPGSR